MIAWPPAFCAPQGFVYRWVCLPVRLPLSLPVCLVGAAAWCWFSGGARYLRLLEVLLAVGLAEGRALGLTVT